MKTVHKYVVPIEDTFEIMMPHGAELLDVQWQPWEGKPFVWALVDPEQSATTRAFRLAGTGHAIASEVRKVGTFQMPDHRLVFHLFERIV